MKKILITFSTVFWIGLSYSQATDTENYIQTRTYLEPVTTTSSTAKQVQTVQYFDGLGRPKQVVDVKASPLGNDVITHIEYDNFGRQVFDFLPVPQSNTANGAISTDPLSNATQQDIYGTERIWSKKEFEASPLDRILEQKQVGNAWDSKPVTFNYDANISGEVIRFTTITTWVNSATKSQILNSGSYGTAQLYKNTVTDEDGNKTIEFKNGEGQTILVRKVVSDSENADTYYVYNEYNQLAFVIPPLASIATLDEAALNNLCYQYRYDGRNRLVEKKLPGKGWELMVYDKNDRLVLSQDAMLGTVNNNFTKKGWLFTKYDKFGRVVYTGFFANTASRTSMQTALNNMNSGNVETRNTTPFTLNGMDVYYTKTAFPTGSMTILSVNYYDTYPTLPPNVTAPSSVLGQSVITDNLNNNVNTKSLPLASYVKNIENDNWTKNFTWYDYKGRAILTHSVNHLGGNTRTESELDFAGVSKKMITRHKRLDSDSEKVITETFEYDHQNRLKLHKHQVDNYPVEYLAQNEYNELSQIKTKKIGGQNLGNSIQQMNYTYNVRGWLTMLNDPLLLNNSLFGYELRYQNPKFTNLASGSYNGNISEIDWKSASDGILKRYTYEYDMMSRLKKANYSEPESSVPQNHFFDEEVSYDSSGNIKTLKRYSKPYSGNIAEKIDDLIYNYENNNRSNKLQNVTLPSGISNNYSGYNALGNIISYDFNGNMTNHLDKGTDYIKYNYLNLVRESGAYSGNEKSMYLYQSDGIKIQKTEEYPLFLKYKKVTDYFDGFQYETVEDNWTYSQTSLKFIPTSEGYYNFENNKYIYNYLDHLGNIRLSYFLNGTGVEVIEEKNYYPLGLLQSYYSLPSSATIPAYNFGYNGKEYQPILKMTDLGARMYIAELGRFGSHDPLSSITLDTYGYANNNPISFNDPTGMMAQEAAKCPPQCPEFGNNGQFKDIEEVKINTPIKAIQSNPASIMPNNCTVCYSGGNMIADIKLTPPPPTPLPLNWNCGHCNDGPIKFIGGAGDVFGIWEILGIFLSSSEDSNVKMASIPILILSRNGDDAMKILAANRGMMIGSNVTKKGMPKADFLFKNSNDAKNFGASILGNSKSRIYNESGKWIGWKNESGGTVYWKHGDWGAGQGSSTFPHLNYNINGQKGHFFLQNKIDSKGMTNEFKSYFNTK